MKELFDTVSFECSKLVTRHYSTSFSMGTALLGKKIKKHIYNIYGFVRFADEIVDSFHKFSKNDLLDKFENDLLYSIENKISLNPILNSFQHTVNENNIEIELINSFMNSMRLDLHKKSYKTESEYKKYIYGSADVVGLMCLKVFVKGNKKKYDQLKPHAMALGSAFQKVNFLRDLKVDSEDLKRNYFPDVNVSNFDEKTKQKIVFEIENDFKIALVGINKLPDDCRLGVYTAYKYYKQLLFKLKRTSSLNIKRIRIRIPNYQKIVVLAKSYLKFHLKLI